MPSSLSSHLKLVIDAFTPEILGAFWITEDELSRNLVGFDEFNYLFDGLISQYLYGQFEQNNNALPRSNVFFTNNFNEKLFLAHFKNDSDISGVLDDQIALIQENTGGRKKILILNKTPKDWVSHLKKRYPKFEFCHFEIK